MFGKNLKMLRKIKKLSQEELSEILNVSRQSVSKYENDSAQPSFETLMLVADYFDVSVDELLGRDAVNKDIVLSNGSETKMNIVITSEIENKTSSFFKFIASPVIGKKAHHPAYMLLGVDNVSFWGENKVALAWYATEADYGKEIAEIMQAIDNRETIYKLQYFTDIKKRGIFDIEILKKAGNRERGYHGTTKDKS
jgi:transcriptional regulator with XRE-family HTH domain